MSNIEHGESTQENENAKNAEKLSLQERIEKLKARIKDAKNQTQRGEGNSPEENVLELENIYSEGKGLEPAREKLSHNIEAFEQELREFQEIRAEAEVLGIPIEEDGAFMTGFQEARGELAELEERQAVLLGYAKKIAESPEVIEKIMGEAKSEDQKISIERHRGEFEKYKQEYTDASTELRQTTERLEQMSLALLSPVAEKMLGDKKMVEVLGLENITPEELSQLFYKYAVHPAMGVSSLEWVLFQRQHDAWKRGERGLATRSDSILKSSEFRNLKHFMGMAIPHETNKEYSEALRQERILASKADSARKKMDDLARSLGYPNEYSFN